MAENMIAERFSKLDIARRLNTFWDAFDRFASGYTFAGTGRRYVLCGNALINQEIAENDPELSSRIIGLHGRFKQVHLPFSANEVLVGRTNTRIFGFEEAPKHTAKILRARSGQRSLFAEIRANLALRSKLADSPHVFIPALHSHDREQGQWLVEELVDGVASGRSGLLPFLAAGAARDFYRATARLDPIGRRRMTAGLPRELAELDPAFPVVPDDAILPVAILHGDLYANNLMLAADGRFCIVDLEKAFVGPVAADLATVYKMRRSLRQYILQLLRRLDPTGSAIPAEAQLALGIVLASRDHRHRTFRRNTEGVKAMLATLRTR